MGKGAMKRDNHHCPERGRGGCRWVDEPVHYCERHAVLCPEHNLPHYDWQECLSCKGERLAAERDKKAAKNNKDPESGPNNSQNCKGYNKVSKKSPWKGQKKRRWSKEK